MSDLKISRLTDHLGYWLRMVSNAVSGQFADRLAESGFSVAEWVLLRELLDGDLRPSELAARMGMTRGGITKLADRLIARGLVLRRPGDADGRVVALTLSDAGRAATPDLAALADDNDRYFFGAMPAADRETLRRLLDDLARRHGIAAPPVD